MQNVNACYITDLHILDNMIEFNYFSEKICEELHSQKKYCYFYKDIYMLRAMTLLGQLSKLL